LRHLARATDIARWLESTSAQLHAISQVLDRFPVGVIQLDRNGAVTEVNAAALRIAQVRNGLTITTAGVHAVTEGDEARLQKAIATATAYRGGDYMARMSIRRRSGPPSGVVVTSIDHPHRAIGDDQTCCVLFVIDPEARYEFEPSAIVELLGLTLAEARVVAALAMGTALPEAAIQLGVTVNTVRTLLSRAMSKTGTNSQTGIVRLVLTALVPLPSRE
jgi:DNA-binding CsgD family transcriptional regulator